MIKETLYYDGACPLCSREMKHLAKLKRDSLDLVDIHQTDITQDMPSKEDLLLNLHLKRGDEWVVGADANVAAWQHTRLAAVGVAALACSQTDRRPGLRVLGQASL